MIDGFFVHCTKIMQYLHGVLSIRSPLPYVAYSPPLHILKMKMPSLPSPPATCCPPAATFEENGHARITDVNIAVEAHDS
jgi:hypothetical protein